MAELPSSDETNKEVEQSENVQYSIPVKAQITISEPLRVTITEPEKAPDAAAGIDKETILELYKLGYTTGVKRHDDIFKGLWTNFSYMAILAGGILTFGKGVLPNELVGALACLPLIFWFWSSFLPLDRYGDQVSQTMEQLEGFINTDYFNNQNPPLADAGAANQNAVNEKRGLFLYTSFQGRKKGRKYKGINPLKIIRQNTRVIHTVTVFAIVLHFTAGYCTYKFFTKTESTNSSETTEKKLQSINDTLRGMSNSLSGLKDSSENSGQKGEAGNNNSNAQALPQTAVANKVNANK
jgi:hypothetical protein